LADGAAVWRPVARCVVFCSPCMKGCSRGRYPYGLCSMADLSLRNIKKIYDKNVTAVHEFNLEIADKEFIVLVGPSGCGKSTTLRMIAGLEDISEGDLLIGGKRVNDVEPKDRDIAMVFQSYALYPHMTVYENMAFSLKLRHVSKDEIDKKVRDAAAILGITEYLERKPKALSGGQRQRVAIGRAIVREPQVFLMDEPLSNLDAKLRTAMRSEISRLHKRLQTTFVYVTHDQTEAMTMGDRIVVMKDGIIQQMDTPQNLYDFPCNLFVAGFIGSPQMNFLDAVISESNGVYRAEVCGNLITLSDRMDKKKLAPYVGKTVVLGIRPEDVDAVSADRKHDLEANIEIAELMGAEINLHLDCKGSKLVVRAASTFSGREGDVAALNFDVEKVHLFDKETELAIAH